MRVTAALVVNTLCVVLGLSATPTAATAPAAQRCHGERATIVISYSQDGIESGTPQRDVVIIEKHANVLEFLAGAGDDVVCLRQGANDDEDAPPTVYGGRGDDLLIATEAPYSPHLRGDRGADVLIGSPGFDYLVGGPGPDRLFGGGDRDILSGDDGDDVLQGGRGDDEGDGGTGRDLCRKIEDRTSCLQG